MLLVSVFVATATAGFARAEADELARVTWQSSPRPPFNLFFETDSRGMEDLAPEPEAFLTAEIITLMVKY